MFTASTFKRCGVAAAAVTMGAVTYAWWRKAAAPKQLLMDVYTDIKPDGVMALGVLHLRGFTNTSVTAGEGNAFDRQNAVTDVVYRCLAPYEKRSGLPGWRGGPGGPGFDSKDLGPGEVTPASNRHAVDGPQARGTTSLCLDSLRVHDLLSSFHQPSPWTADHNMSPVILCLKPPQEIAAMLEHHPEWARKLFKNTTLVINTANLRAPESAKFLFLVQEDRTPFKKVYVYDSRANPGVPNLNSFTVPNITDWFVHMPLFQEVLLKHHREWDAHTIAHRLNETPARHMVAKQFYCGPEDGVLALLLANKDFEPYLQAVRVEPAPSRGFIMHGRPVEATSKVVAWMDMPGDKVLTELSRVCTLVPLAPAA